MTARHRPLVRVAGGPVGAVGDVGGGAVEPKNQDELEPASGLVQGQAAGPAGNKEGRLERQCCARSQAAKDTRFPCVSK